MLSRLGARDDVHVCSAYSELFLHAILCRLVDAVAVEPATPSGGRTEAHVASWNLDFEVLRPAPPSEFTAHTNRVRAVEDAFESVVSPDFGLGLSVELASTQSPATAKVRAQVEAWVDGLDWATERQRLEVGTFDVPTKVWTGPGNPWRIEVSAWARSADARGSSSTVEMWQRDPFVATAETLLSRLDGKYDQHHRLDRPLVIVVDISGSHLHPDEVEDALFGPTVEVAGTSPRRTYRRRSGCLWPEGLRKPVAVLTIDQLVLGFERGAVMRWYRNPSCAHDHVPGPWAVVTLAPDGYGIRVEAAETSTSTLLDAPPAMSP